MKPALIITALVLAASTLGAQTNDPTDTPTVRALMALLPLKGQADFGQALVVNVDRAKHSKYLFTLGDPDKLLQLKARAEKSNYNGNAFEKIRKEMWVRLVEGEPLR